HGAGRGDDAEAEEGARAGDPQERAPEAEGVGDQAEDRRAEEEHRRIEGGDEAHPDALDAPGLEPAGEKRQVGAERGEAHEVVEAQRQKPARHGRSVARGNQLPPPSISMVALHARRPLLRPGHACSALARRLRSRGRRAGRDHARRELGGGHAAGGASRRPGARIGQLRTRHRYEPEALRALVLREGYAYAPDPLDALAIVTDLSLPD